MWSYAGSVLDIFGAHNPEPVSKFDLNSIISSEVEEGIFFFWLTHLLIPLNFIPNLNTYKQTNNT